MKTVIPGFENCNWLLLLKITAAVSVLKIVTGSSQYMLEYQQLAKVYL